MDWSDVTDLIGDAAPLLGKLLPFPGAAIVGELVGRALGTEPSPEKVVAAIRNDPEWAIKLKRLETSHEAELMRLQLTAETNRLAQINMTMRSEATSKFWYQAAWRPFWGFISGLAFLCMVIGVLALSGMAVASRDWEMLRYIPDLVSASAMLFATPLAILGVASHHRGKEKRALAGEATQQGAIGRIVERVMR